MTYEWITDPGHGWLKVPLADLHATKAEITPFSYMDGTFAYLEEDCDAGAFITAAGITNEAFRAFPERYLERCFIRGLRSYSGPNLVT